MVWANDINQHTVSTFNANFAQPCVLGDLVDILKSSNIEIPIADVVIGSPPIRGFSLLSKNRQSNSIQELWQPFLEVVKLSNAQIFVMEHVLGVLSLRLGAEYKDILNAAKNLGFHIAWSRLCAADFGVPQLRKRVFLIGCRFADPTDFFPQKTHSQSSNDLLLPQLEPWRTVRDAIADLPPPESIGIRDEPPPFDLHFGHRLTPQNLADYQAIPVESNNYFNLPPSQLPETVPQGLIGKQPRRRYPGSLNRLRWDQPAPLLLDLFYHTKRYLHPEQHRPITHREAARLQSFPDSFHFCGTPPTIAQQIGRAVPPLLAARIADSIYDLLLSREKKLDCADTSQLILWSQPVLELSVDSDVEEIDISDELKEIPLEESAITQGVEAAELIAKLNKIQPGWDSWREYEDVCIEIFNYLFIPPFDHPHIQSNSEDGLDRRDAIYFISGEDSIWNRIERQFNTLHVLVEFKNLKDAPGQEEINSTSKYLRKRAKRLFGILCTRKPASKSAITAQRRVWQDDDKMIVLLCDKQLKEMLFLKATGANPARLIENQIDKFLISF